MITINKGKCFLDASGWVFVDVPKNASTSIKKALRMNESEQKDINYLAKHEHILKRFAVVREPVSRFISAFLQYKKMANKYESYTNEAKSLGIDIHTPSIQTAFSQYITAIENYGFIDDHCRSQSFYIDGLNVDKLVSINNLDLSFLRKGVKIPIENQKPMSVKLALRSMIEDESYDIILQTIYKKDFELWSSIK